MVRFVGLGLVTLALMGCGRSSPYALLEDSVGDGTGDDGDDAGESTGVLTCADVPEQCTVRLELRRAVDILFVIDNSGSMGGEQGTLAQSFASFIQVLEDQQVGANYRIGLTTTDGTGSMRATSCRSRLHEFQFSWAFGDIDERQRGCLDNCSIGELTLNPPWVEKGAGTTNVPNGIDLATALQCIGPQGVNGPGFEAPLESMRAALIDNPNGFVRDDALLAVIFVTDEADCSMDFSTAEWIQSFDGSVFWTTGDRASSGACWKAGVTCSGGPGTYDDCYAEDKNRDGLPTDSEDDAVLYPKSRFENALTAIAQEKQELGGQGEVLVALIAGVPLDYPQTGELVYADSFDPAFTAEYGIGPGCGQGTETIHDPPGIPPVRLKEFAESFQTVGNNIFSVCDNDYSVALQDIAAAIGEVNTRACVAGCVSDTEPGTSGLQPACMLVEKQFADDPGTVVPKCNVSEQGWQFPTPGANVCYRSLTDRGNATLSPWDNMSAQCRTVGSNLELVVERRDGIPVASGTSVEVRCDLEAPAGVLCEDL